MELFLHPPYVFMSWCINNFSEALSLACVFMAVSVKNVLYDAAYHKHVAYSVLVRNGERRDCLEYVYLDRKLILRWMWKEN